MCSACGHRKVEKGKRFLCHWCNAEGRAVTSSDEISYKDVLYLMKKLAEIERGYIDNPPVPTRIYSADKMTQEELWALVPKSGIPIYRSHPLKRNPLYEEVYFGIETLYE